LLALPQHPLFVIPQHPLFVIPQHPLFVIPQHPLFVIPQRSGGICFCLYLFLPSFWRSQNLSI
jgi:hypothetical protein